MSFILGEKKSKMCFYKKNFGTCYKGDRCPYAHSEDELLVYSLDSLDLPIKPALKNRKIVKFSDNIEIKTCDEYDRSVNMPSIGLTRKEKSSMYKELNDFKLNEMNVHKDSRHLTKFHH